MTARVGDGSDDAGGSARERAPDLAELGDVLASVGLDSSRIEPVLGGWASWTFQVDGTRIVRFPRTEVVAHAARRELALLPELADHVSFAVPRPTHQGAWRGRPFFAYRRIPGRALLPSDDSPGVRRALARMLAELHGFPVERAAHLIGVGDPESSWRQRYEELWPEVAGKVLPLLEDRLADDVRQGYDDFLAMPFEFPHCLVHNDLGPEHVLLDDVDGQAPSGLIDFEDSWIGDPVIDVVPLAAILGPTASAALLAGRDVGGRVTDRMWFYRWMGSVHAILYGVDEDEEGERRAGVEQLRRRIAAR